MPAIETEALSKIFRTGMRKGDVVALDGVSIQVQPGEIFGLLGPNGAGKTTLFKILLSLVRPTSGTAMMNGFAPDDPRSRQKVGYLPENHRFPNHLTGNSLLTLTGRMHCLPDDQIVRRSAELLKLVGLDRWGATKIRKYSKGMLQRVGLAQSLIADPELLLLDEPTDGVDPVGRVEIREILKRVAEEGRTIIINSHLLPEVEAVADRVAILSKGRLIRVSTIEELTRRQSHYEFDAEIGNRTVKIDPEHGKIITLTATKLVAELKDPVHVNDVIDEMRLKGIAIRAITPMRMSLEQSFIEAVSTMPKEPS